MDQKMIAGDRFEKPLGVKKKKRSPMLVESGENLYKVEEEKKKNKYSGQKRRKREKGNKVDACKMDQFNIKDKSIEAGGEKKKGKSLREKKRKNEKKNKAVIAKVDELDHKVEDGASDKKDYDGMVGPRQSESQEKIENSKGPKEADSGKDFRTRKSRKASKNKKTDHLSSKKDKQLLKKRGEAEPDVVYQISSGDEDCSKGMKKWITEYHQSRPGLKILQQRIDDFITTHEAQEEQARKEREALAAEGGWTVVVHHKGRKKTTDSESGITVGSVAQVAVLDKMAKKKSKDYGLDFYRFQRREAQRNEIMMLRSKFEQDRKRIQELRAARKFRPY